MNIFRSLIGKVWQDPNAAEVVKISTGQLYLVRPGNIRSSKECIYNEAMVTIRRVPSIEHNFQLVVTRVYEDGDQELLEDEDETDEERVFLISEELEFRTGETADKDPNFVWRDLEGDVDELYEFVAAGTNEPTRAFFETCMYRAIYERKYKTGAENTQDADLEEFIWQPPTSGMKKAKGKRKASKGSTDPSTAAEGLSSTKSSSKPRQVPESFSELVSHPAELYLWDLNLGEFVVPQGLDSNPSVTARIFQRPSSFEYWLVADSDEHGHLFAHRITSDMNQRWINKLKCLTWNYMGDGGGQSSWSFTFYQQNEYEEFMYAFSKAIWERLHGLSWDRAKSDEQDYVKSSYSEDVEMKDLNDDDDDEEDVAGELFRETDQSDSELEYEEPVDDEDLPPAPTKGDHNSQLTVGYKGDRSYVVRGNNIGVFSHGGDNQVKYYATISKVSTPKGKEFKPKEVMLHDQDSKMILMNPTDPHSLFSMDIERGKVVEEWKVHDDVNVDHIAPHNKFAQTTREQTLVGASHNALFRIDPRMSGNKMVDSQFKQYVSKNKFSGVATTDSGKLAVASEKGDIRLFDSIGKNAKTALPPLGDPILGIDVTANGRWIVATTKTYLLLIDTLIGEGRYQGSLGFDRSFPATAKPIPKRLQLRSEHVAYMNHDVSFTPARFNQGEGQEENAIVTSTGQFVIAWDFTKVRKGQLDKYEIKKYEDLVVQDNFKFGDDKNIIVALQNNVLAINKKNLKRPTRNSLAPPIGNPKSRSSIVNSPY